MIPVLLTILGVLLLLAGFLGCILPILPGPPIAYLALLALSLDRGWDTFSVATLVGLGVLVAVVVALDLAVPVIGAKRYGASRAAIWLSLIGMLAGLIWLPPLGMLGGAFLGAFLGEMLAGKSGSEALRPAWGVFVGTIVGTGLKLACCAVIAWYYVAAWFG